MLPDSVPPIFAIALVAAIVFTFVLTMIVPNCSRAENARSATAESQQDETTGTAQATQSAADNFEVNASDPRQAKLVELLGEDTTRKLLVKAMGNPDVMWIAAHVDDYAFNGLEAQYKAMKLAADEDAAVPFVRSYPTAYPQATPSAENPDGDALPSGSPASDVPETNIPHLYQWDSRWGNTAFANTALGLSGAGPTCLAMVQRGLTDSGETTPYDLAKTVQDAQNAVEDKRGMKADYLFDGASSLGLECIELYPSYNTILEYLLTDHVIILVSETGAFESWECYCVLTGLTGNNKVIMNDPASMERSSKLWDIDELAAAAKTMYAYSRP